MKLLTPTARKKLAALIVGVPLVGKVIYWLYYKRSECAPASVQAYYWLRSRFSRQKGLRLAKARTPQLIITLTSFPGRIHTVSTCIESLLAQTIQPDRIVLYLAEEEFPGRQIPAVLSRQVARGLTIQFVPNLMSYKKLFFALKEFPDAVLVTVDDDVVYRKNMLEDLYKSYQSNPRAVHCHRAHYMTMENGNLRPYAKWTWGSDGMVGPDFRLFPTGVGGILYPPKILHPEVMNQQAFQALAPYTDDVWFKAMALLNNVPTVKVRKKYSDLRVLYFSQTYRLYDLNESGNDESLVKVFSKYRLFEKLSPSVFDRREIM